jgi:hypothetical protein
METLPLDPANGFRQMCDKIRHLPNSRRGAAGAFNDAA